MFRNIVRMDLKRCFCSGKFIAITAGVILMLFGTARDYVLSYLTSFTPEERQTVTGAVDLLHHVMGFDVFKVVIVLMLSGLYTGSFCQDENSQYLRMILSRNNTVQYTRSKFLTNAAAIITASVTACSLFALVLVALGFPLVSKDAQGGLLGAVYYRVMAKEYPMIYIWMTGLQFGMVAAACSSVGLLFSSYQANGFASIGVSGLLFFILLSFSVTILNGTPFDVLNLVGMSSVLPAGRDADPWLMFAWGMMYPLIAIVLCCLKFEQRMKWRAEHGII